MQISVSETVQTVLLLENFLLQTETAQKLYHEHAKKMPIIVVAVGIWENTLSVMKEKKT